MKNFLLSKKEAITVAAAGLTSVLLVAGMVYSATTISTDVNTGGTLTVSGASTLTGLVTVGGSGYVSQASSTVVGAFRTAGAVTFDSTLAVTGASTFTGRVGIASSTPVVANELGVQGNVWISGNLSNVANVTATGTLGVTGLSTLSGGLNTALASSTSLLVGSEPNNTVSGIMLGFCTIADISVVVASSTVQTTCAGATNMTTSYRVFVQATSSMPRQIVIQSATSSAGAIEVRLYNPTGGIGTPVAAPVSLNYWAVK